MSNIICEPIIGKRIKISGVVQGVGFRPFIYGLAKKYQLNGWVCNTSAGVKIEISGGHEKIILFEKQIREKAPPLAKIEKIFIENIQVNGFKSFEIIKSQPVEGAFQPISPDVSICDDCLKEILDRDDRHYRYPFTNCTNCGPRYTIIYQLPYDRPYTTMAEFLMCGDCKIEYQDPLDRRYHAQPIACPKCGPILWLKTTGQIISKNDDALREAREKIKEGKIVAVKGLGGFHLVCDASNTKVVEKLREKKHRKDKSFALMMVDIDTVRQYCSVDKKEEETLRSIERPIVILDKKSNSRISELVSPGQIKMGVMLPYTPMHYLLLEKEKSFPEALVMTSGNLSGEPIIIDNQLALNKLSNIADYFLMHEREIHIPCDDSVVRIIEKNNERVLYPIRRARGYAPYPIKTNKILPQILATGAQLKNTFCLSRENNAFLSPHIGNLENYQTYEVYKNNISHIEKLFSINPEIIVHDLHPGYLSSKYAKERSSNENIARFEVQHHHAHIAACMAENNLDGDRPVIGVSFDGTGYGTDGAIWGGEFMLVDYSRFERLSHLEYIPMPGGEKAVREPYRLAYAWVDHYQLSDQVGGERDLLAEEEKRILTQLIKSKINTPMTSSMGRFFDAISALINVCQLVNYEAQAAIELEAIADPDQSGAYHFDIGEKQFSPAPIFNSILVDLDNEVSKSVISSKFHNGVAQMVRDVCLIQSKKYKISDIVLSGGVWQNCKLLSKTITLLTHAGLNVFTHQLVPTNDGGIALGQTMIAAKLFKET